MYRPGLPRWTRAGRADAEWFARICPGKAHMLGQALFFEAMDLR